VFPFEREILIGPAQFYFANKIATKEGFDLYKEALDYDPYSIQFLGAVTQIEYLMNNRNEAQIHKQKLEKIGPNSKVLKKINEYTKGLK